MTLYAALLGQAWNILGGYGGQFSFGHAAFFGTGAYTVAVLQVQLGVNPWIGSCRRARFLCRASQPSSALRRSATDLRGSYFALVTLAFAEVLRILSNSVGFTGAGVGLLIPLERSAAQSAVRRQGRLFLADLGDGPRRLPGGRGGSAIRASARN